MTAYETDEKSIEGSDDDIRDINNNYYYIAEEQS